MLADRAYVSRLVEELFKNAGVAAACGEIAPLTRRRRRLMTRTEHVLRALSAEFGIDEAAGRTPWQAFLKALTVIHRSALYRSSSDLSPTVT